MVRDYERAVELLRPWVVESDPEYCSGAVQALQAAYGERAANAMEELRGERRPPKPEPGLATPIWT